MTTLAVVGIAFGAYLLGMLTVALFASRRIATVLQANYILSEALQKRPFELHWEDNVPEEVGVVIERGKS